MLRRHPLALVLLLAAPLSGCIGSGDETEPSATSTEGTLSGAEVAPNATENVTESTPEATSIGDQPHVHDYWLGVDTKVLMDEDLPTSSATETTLRGIFRAFFRSQPVNASVGGAYFRLPDGVTVIEGTRSLILDLDASRMQFFSGNMKLYYHTAGNPEWVETEPIGKTGQYLIDLAPIDADIAHSKSSRWEFLVLPHGSPAYMNGTLHVTITAKKGLDILVMPGHGQHFLDSNILDVMDKDVPFSSTRTLFFADEEGTRDVKPDPGRIIPPGTQFVKVELSWEISQGAELVDGLILLYHDASSANYRCYEQRGNGGFGCGDSSEQEGDGKKGSRSYTIEASPQTVDSPYAEESAWAFGVFAYSDTGRQFLGGQIQGKYHLAVQAVGSDEPMQ
ncbi:MAG: hypothetical protein ACT4PT_06375 [Methanobacteriota archaeon]